MAAAATTSLASATPVVSLASPLLRVTVELIGTTSATPPVLVVPGSGRMLVEAAPVAPSQ